MQTTTQTTTLDVREMPQAEGGRHLVQSFDALAESGEVVLLSGRDPAPLFAELQRERTGAFDWSPLEEGPGLWRAVITKRGPGDERDRSVFEYLEWDHRRLDAMIDETRSLLRAHLIVEARTRFGEFRTGLLRHIRMEEEVLFPAFERATGFTDQGPTSVMRLEHQEIQGALERIRILLTQEAPEAGAFVSLESALGATLGPHNVKEEQVVYPMTDRALSTEERQDLIRRMRGI